MKTLLEIIDVTNEPNIIEEIFMDRIRIEIHLTDKEVKALDKLAKQQGRSRKNLCETEIRLIIQSFLSGEEKKDKKKKGNVA